MSNETILIQCPYCSKTWIDEESGALVCKDCEPKMNLDIAIVDILHSLTNITDSDIDILRNRRQELIGLLIAFNKQIGELIKSLEGDSNEETKPEHRGG